ncbi:uncharacterized protein A1O5_03500 [Cladophialophora psammophila CBS 110553]|uniref:Uncharacterized protein n=1 Tax=Cladophialophora psammophila CBS 110553 TaxID=1182543 RepID=W9X0K4_9EURO|nr:uncharacterized protein A1O5_03500 [Cladophialophora psammophila CBS 110553]EXJ73738.1 hypothetical protein A1O5_03500 [Cladophialophora psammophila CBS 110553]
MPVKETGFVQMRELNHSEASLPKPKRQRMIPPAWPSEPKPLANNPFNEITLDMYDVCLCLIPVALMVKIGLCLYAEKQDSYNTAYFIDEVSMLTTYLIRFNNQLATAFTIVFVLIFTTFLKRFALWRAQDGEYVVRLEQYQASMSLISTLRSILVLRAFDSISVGLVILWSFYYLGSQASKDEYTYQACGPYSNFTIAYRNSSAPSAFQNVSYTEYPSSFFDTMTLQYGVYVTSLYESLSQFQSPTSSDYTGGALVPFGSYSARDDPIKSWQDVSKPSANEYTSFAGYYSLNLDSYESSTFVGDYNFETSFLQANCSSLTLLPAAQFPNGTTKSTLLAMNMSDSSVIRETNNYTSRRNFTISAHHNSSVVVQCSCAIARRYVELKVHCDCLSCSARKIRDSRRPHPSQNSTPFDDDIFAARFFQSLLSVNQVTTKQALDWQAVDDCFLSGTGDYGETLTKTEILGNFSRAITFQISVGATQVLNTYYYASQLQGDDPTFPDSDPEDITTDPRFTITHMRGGEYNPRYATNKAWIAVDFLSQTVLLAAAIAAFWLRKNTIAPDIFGYVSSLTRDNPHIDLPDGGTTLGGLERARLLRDVKVRIADVSRDGEVGHVGLVTEAREADMLSKGKVYA